MGSRTVKAARIFWFVAYLLFFLAGILAFFSPAQIVAKTLIHIFVYAWAAFLTSGGIICLAGQLRDNWAGEIIGLPLLSAANYIFGILVLLRGTSSAALAVGGIICGTATALLGRWIELRRLAQENQEVNREI